MQNSESGIPVLTEVLQAPLHGVDVSERRSTPRPEPLVDHVDPVDPVDPVASVDSVDSVDPVDPIDSVEAVASVDFARTVAEPTPSDAANTGAALFDAATRARMEQDISRTVLEGLLGQLDAVLEAHVRDQLADVLQSAVDGLACQLRAGLKQALDASVSLAVAHELDRLQFSKIENLP